MEAGTLPFIYAPQESPQGLLGMVAVVCVLNREASEGRGVERPCVHGLQVGRAFHGVGRPPVR